MSSSLGRQPFLRFDARTVRDRLRGPVSAAGDLCGRFRRDKSGNYLIISAVMMPALIGFVGLGTDYGLWTYTHQALQSAADSAAVSAAWAYFNGNTNLVTTQANAVTSSYGFTNGANGVTVTVNRPPKSGNYTSQAGAVEVIVTKPQAPLFSALFLAKQLTITSRAVARGVKSGNGCVLSLDGTAPGATTGQGTTAVNLTNCSLYDNSDNTSAMTVGGSAQISALSVNVVGGISGQAGITTTQGINQDTGSPIPDPYADVAEPTPSGSTKGNCCSHGTATLDPGIYDKGMKLVAGANITLNPGTYYIEGNGLDMAGGSTLTGTGVTLVFTSSDGVNYATATINGGATVNVTAPTTGPTAGIAVFGDRNMPVGTVYKFNGGSSEVFGGAVYLPKGHVDYAGGANDPNACTQLIGDTITYTGNSNFAINCAGKGTKDLGAIPPVLVE